MRYLLSFNSLDSQPFWARSTSPAQKLISKQNLGQFLTGCQQDETGSCDKIHKKSLAESTGKNYHSVEVQLFRKKI
jgi:hypothetical protein